MKNLKILFGTMLVILATVLIYSCVKEAETSKQSDVGEKLELRSSGCPEPNLSLVTIYGSPCASLKLVYNGTNDPQSTCTFDSFDIKVYKLWDPSTVKTFNSPLVNTIGTYPQNSNWVSPLNGGLVNLAFGPQLAFLNSPIKNVNDTFEYFIPSTVALGDRTWICVEIIMFCDGIECKTPKCFNAYTPCI
jgi:hypothetical protein